MLRKLLVLGMLISGAQIPLSQAALGDALGEQENTTVMYDLDSKNDLSGFELFSEDAEATQQRPGLALSQEGLIGRPGNGNFTAWKFADLTSPNWNLQVVFEVPAGARYSNSGIYLLYQDPDQDLGSLAPEVREAFLEARRLGQNRRERFGPGPFELDFFSHELQIIAGSDASIPPENRGAGAFYGVDLGSEPGTQLVLPYSLNFGDLYELTIEHRGSLVRTFVRSVAHQNERVLVSEFTNFSKADDPLRGGAPKALLLQAYYNNDGDVQLPKFKRIALKTLP
jgi:hypothetical protein